MLFKAICSLIPVESQRALETEETSVGEERSPFFRNNPQNKSFEEHGRFLKLAQYYKTRELAMKQDQYGVKKKNHETKFRI